jgi:hypothetical protein
VIILIESQSKNDRLKHLEEQAMEALKVAVSHTASGMPRSVFSKTSPSNPQVENLDNAVFPNAMIAGRPPASAPPILHNG